MVYCFTCVEKLLVRKKQFIMIYYEKIFTYEECKTIIGYHEKYKIIEGWFPKENIKGQRTSNKRNSFSYEVYIIPNNNETEWFFNKLLHWFSKNNNIKINKNNKIPACTLHRYTKGDHFKKHIDLAKGYEERRWNLGIQLNENYTGGEYKVWDDNDIEDTFPKEPGTAISYHCRTLHEITEILSGERWSIVLPIEKSFIIETKNLL
jgi:hypothetical protein